MKTSYLVLVIYDISDDKKRYKIDRLLSGYGKWVQRSAYECSLTMRLYEKMLSEMLPHFDFGTDLLRVYRLTEHAEIRAFGKIPETQNESVVII